MKKMSVLSTVAELAHVPSTRGGKIRLLGLLIYTGLSVWNPAIPATIKLVAEQLLTVLSSK